MDYFKKILFEGTSNRFKLLMKSSRLGSGLFALGISYRIRKFTVNLQNICNLIDREEYSIGCIVLSISLLYSFTKKQQHSFEFLGTKKKIINQ